MALIDKEKVVNEINRVLNSYDPNEITSGRYALVDLRNFLNTLEVKEVNLDKEARHYLLNEHKSPLLAVFHQTDLHSEIQYHEDIENAFKAGFKLGLKT